MDVRSRDAVEDEYGFGEKEGFEVDDRELVVDLMESKEGRDEEAGVSSQMARKSLVVDGGFVFGFGEVTKDEVEIDLLAVGETMRCSRSDRPAAILNPSLSVRFEGDVEASSLLQTVMSPFSSRAILSRPNDELGRLHSSRGMRSVGRR